MSKLDDACYGSPIRPWMGRYPRKGADWSLEEDIALIREYESGRYLTKEIAARHLREPVAIERRLGLLHARSAARLSVLRKGSKAAPKVNQARDWRVEQEKAQRALDGIKATFASTMWPRCRQDLRKIKVGDIVGGRVVTAVHEKFDAFMLSRAELSDLPPEVAQALQFGQGEES